MAGARHECCPRSGVDRRRRHLGPLGADVAGRRQARLPSSGACPSKRAMRTAARSLARRLEELIAIEAPAAPDVETGRSGEPVRRPPRKAAQARRRRHHRCRACHREDWQWRGAVAMANPRSEDSATMPTKTPASAKRGRRRARAQAAKDDLKPSRRGASA